MSVKTFGDDQTAYMRASIGSVTYRKGAFDNWAKKRFNNLANNIGKVINNYLHIVGEKTKQRAMMIIESSTPSGSDYLIVDEDGHLITSWKASSGGNPPASLTGLLLKSIEYKIGSGGDRADFVEIGVWSEEPWEYETIKFLPAKKDPETMEEGYGRIVTGEGGHITPVRVYAASMEHGFTNKKYGLVEARPFLRPAFEQIVLEGRKELQQQMKQAFTDAFSEKVPVTFRIYVSKEFQTSSKE